MEFRDGQEQKKIFFNKTGKELDYYYFKYRPKLLWNLTKRVKDVVVAEEVTDEAILKAFFEIEKYDSTKSNFSTWLFTIGKNIMTQRIQDNSKTVSVENCISDDENIRIIDQISDVSCDEKRNEEQDHILTEKIKLTVKELMNLPEKYSSVLQMRELDGMSYDEISNHLGINLNTVKSQIKQGRMMLSKILRPKFQDIEEEGVSEFYY